MSNTAYFDGASFARQIGMLPAGRLGRGPRHEERVQRRHEVAPRGRGAPKRLMAVLVALTVGLVWWITAWAFGIKAFDAFLLTAALVVGAAAFQIASRSSIGCSAARCPSPRSRAPASES